MPPVAVLITSLHVAQIIAKKNIFLFIMVTEIQTDAEANICNSPPADDVTWWLENRR